MSDWVDAISNVVSAGYNIYTDQRNFKHAQQEAARNQANVAWNQAFSQNQFDYMKQQNDLTREREDNALQRKVADLKKAGLNPLLAAGATGAMAQGVAAGGQPPSAGNVSRNVSNNIELDMRLHQMDIENRLAKSQIDKDESESALNSALARKAGGEADTHERVVTAQENLAKAALDTVQVRDFEARNARDIGHTANEIKELMRVDNLRDIRTREIVQEQAYQMAVEALYLQTLMHQHQIGKDEFDMMLRDFADQRAEALHKEEVREAMVRTRRSSEYSLGDLFWDSVSEIFGIGERLKTYFTPELQQRSWRDR